MNQYAYSIDLNNEYSSWPILIRWVGHNRRVLDVGCGRGQMGSILHQKFGCTVTGIEINPEYARECQDYAQVIIGNLEDEALLSGISEQFDVILCGDVLEHLREPEIPLRAFHRLLNPQGHLLVSVPNVAQIRIRLMLLRGRWDYTPEGIMDKTHLRWFTLESLNALVSRCGWKQNAFDFTVGPNAGRFLQRYNILKKFFRPALFASQFLMSLSSSANIKRNT